MICPTRIVIRCSLARGSIWALAVTAWLILSALVPGNAPDGIRAHTGHANIASQALSGYGKQAHPPCKSRRFGGVDLEMREGELKGKPSIGSQCRSVAFTA
jgi:hypothetical protein